MRNVSRAAVTKAVSDGRIQLVEGKYIYPPAADAAWRANTDPAKVRTLARADTARTDPPPLAPPSAFEVGEHPPGDFESNRAVREYWMGEKVRLEVEEIQGKLLVADEVRKEIFEASRAARDHFAGIPNRVASICATIDDPAQINHIILQEVNLGLQAFSRALRCEDR